MGVDRKDYIVVGVDLESRPDDYYKGDIDELCDKYYFRSGNGEMVFIDDFYNGRYFIVGEILQASNGYDGSLDYSLFGKEQQIELAKARVKAFIKQHFNIDTIPYVLVKTQWS